MTKEQVRAQRAKHYQKHRESILAKKAEDYATKKAEYSKRNAAQYLAHREERLAKAKQRYWDDPSKSAARKARSRQRINKREREKFQSDVQFRIGKILRNRLRRAITLQDLARTGSAIDLLGCTINEARAHLESLFIDGMSWENYGHKGWHIDHIRPLISFDLEDPKQLAEACHYTNLQPLWASDNHIKGSRVG